MNQFVKQSASLFTMMSVVMGLAVFGLMQLEDSKQEYLNSTHQSTKIVLGHRIDQFGNSQLVYNK